MSAGIRYRNISAKPDKKDNSNKTFVPKQKKNNCNQVLPVFSLCMLLCLLIGYWKSPIQALPFRNWNSVKLTGIFEINNGFTNAIKIPDLPGPESVVEDSKGYLYTGLGDGRIVRIIPNKDGSFVKAKVEQITSGVIPDATVTTNYLNHGRPLGLFLAGEILYVVDCIYGLYSVNVVSGILNVLVEPSATTPPLAFPNDLSVSDDHNFIYFTDVSEDFALNGSIYGTFEGGCTGRVFEYAIATKKVRLVSSKLCGANGVQILPGNNVVIVAEISSNLITWIDTKTRKIIRRLSLPFMPDGILKNRDGTYWVVGSHVPRSYVSGIYYYPWIRQTLIGLLPRDVCAILFVALFNNFQHGVIVEMLENGEIIRTLHDSNGSHTYGLAHALQLQNGKIALASYIAPFLTIVEFKA